MLMFKKPVSGLAYILYIYIYNYIYNKGLRILSPLYWSSTLLITLSFYVVLKNLTIYNYIYIYIYIYIYSSSSFPSFSSWNLAVLHGPMFYLFQSILRSLQIIYAFSCSLLVCFAWMKSIKFIGLCSTLSATAHRTTGRWLERSAHIDPTVLV